ncbi:MAG TPA: helix-turn-helix domain-containing protein [Solirubrobacteraceae bacterium]|nr:helix-turn-helix domain-containing protein [Solirubrobacteraceae bacterium]
MKNVSTDTARARADVLTVQDVADICRVSTDSVYRAIQRGELEAEEIFGRLRVRRGALKEYRRERRRALKRQVVGRRAMQPASESATGSLRALIRGERRRVA